MGISSFLTNVAGSMSLMAKRSLSSYNRLETTDGGSVIVAKDGSLVSLIRVDGTREMMGSPELANFIDLATIKLSPAMGKPGHAMQVWFCRDPDLAPELVREINRSPRAVAERLQLEMQDVFSEREAVLPKFIVHEAFYIALWTRVAVLTKPERQRLALSQRTPPMWPRAMDTQAAFVAARQMTTRHRALISSFVEDMNGLGIRSEALEAHAALKAIKASIYPDMTSSPWRPHLPGDEYKDINGKRRAMWARRPEGRRDDMAHLLWPRLDDQLFDREAEVINAHLVRVGKYVYGGLDMSIGPQDSQPFSDLLGKMYAEEFPWRVSFLLEGDGLPKFAVKSFLAGIAQFSNSDNKNVRDAIQELKLYKQSGGVVPRIRVSFATWAPADQQVLAEERVSRLQKAVEGWGFCIVNSSAGDPLACTMSTALGLDVASTATAGLAPLPEAISMMPWMRDSSPFQKGEVMFRTLDGRPWPFQSGSDKQAAFIDIVYSPSGGGKSVWLNTMNLAFCLSPLSTSGSGRARLPLMAITDIGGSSEGLISLIKEALPPERRHEAVYRRLRMIREHAINVLDTQLGNRRPLPHEKAFLVDFVTLLGTDPSEKNAPRGLSDMADRAIDALYDLYSDDDRGSQPKPYVETEDKGVDEAIRKHGIRLSSEPSWWEVTDKLFDRGDTRHASLAQRHAVPLIGELIQIVNTPQITDMFQNAQIEGGGERLISVFQRVMSSCLKAYPILGSPTRFDLADARVMSLDLDEASGSSSGGPGRKQTAMVYMLARYVMARDFYLVNDNVADMPPKYRDYHKKRISRIQESPKRIVYDEYHRTEDSPMVRQQVVRDAREGRKANVQVAIASQILDDFDKEMLSLATGFWIFGVNNEADMAKAKAMFGLSTTATAAVANHLHGPSRRGAPFLVVLRMNDGRHEHLLYNTLGPIELWAFSTKAEDKALRKRVYERLGPIEGRRRLAQRFPAGSAKSEIQRRISEQNERGDYRADQQEGVTDQLAHELIGQASQ